MSRSSKRASKDVAAQVDPSFDEALAEFQASSQAVVFAPGFEPSQRQVFIDLAAIARFGQGYPVNGCYREAAKLWDARCAFLAKQEER